MYTCTTFLLAIIPSDRIIICNYINFNYALFGNWYKYILSIACGAKMESIGGLGKRILKLKDVFAEKDLVAHDVYPDGNCQFSAVIDQLRMQGNFCYTVPSLRRAAVNFLRDHPYTVSGLHTL